MNEGAVTMTNYSDMSWVLLKKEYSTLKAQYKLAENANARETLEALKLRVRLVELEIHRRVVPIHSSNNVGEIV